MEGTQTKTYVYGTGGNLSVKGSVNLPCGDAGHPHAVTTAGSNKHDYGASGSMTKKLFPLLFLLWVAACSGTSKQVSFLDRSSCKLPCWNGIVAGQTTEAELLRVMSNLPDIGPESIKNEHSPRSIFDNRILFSSGQRWALNRRSRIRGYVYITQDTVSQLIICGELKSSMGRLVGEIGEPDHILSGNDITGGRTVTLIDSESGISYWFTTSLDKLEIMPDTEISCIQIFDIALYEKMLEAKIFSDGYYDAEETMRVWYPWEGYGNLDEKYPPRQP